MVFVQSLVASLCPVLRSVGDIDCLWLADSGGCLVSKVYQTKIKGLLSNIDCLYHLLPRRSWKVLVVEWITWCSIATICTGLLH